MTNIDLYLNALSLVNWDGAIVLMAWFMSIITSLGTIGGLGFRLVDWINEINNHLAEQEFWMTAHDDSDGLVRSPMNPFTVPEHMADWPTLQEIQEQERQWEESGMNQVFVDALTYSSLFDTPEPREDEDEEAELDELWERIYGKEQDTRCSLLHQYMLAMN